MSTQPLTLTALLALTALVACGDKEGDGSPPTGDDTAATGDDGGDDSGEVDQTDCGDGVTEGDEQCDDGNDEPLDGCDNDCQVSQDLCEDVSCDATEPTCEDNVALPAYAAGSCVVRDSEAVCERESDREPVDCSAQGNGYFCDDAACQIGVVEMEANLYWADGIWEVDLLLSDQRVVRFDGSSFTDLGYTDAVRVTRARDTTCVLTASAEVWCEGANAWGQFGTGDTEPTTVPVKLPLPSGETPVDVAATTNFVAVLTDAGDVRLWGRLSPEPDPQGDVVVSDVVSLGQGEMAVGCVQSDGTLVALGYPGWGVDGAINTWEGLDIETADGGWDTMGGVRDGGKVWHLGKDGGVAGNGPTEDADTDGQIIDVQGLSGAVDVTHSHRAKCAVLTDGGLQCWESSLTPADIALPDGVVARDVEATINRSVLVVDAGGRLYKGDWTSGTFTERVPPGMERITEEE